MAAHDLAAAPGRLVPRRLPRGRADRRPRASRACRAARESDRLDVARGGRNHDGRVDRDPARARDLAHGHARGVDRGAEQRRAGPPDGGPALRSAVEAAGIEPASRAATERGSPSSAYVQVSPDPSTQAARLGPVRHSGLSQSARTPRCETSLLNDAILLSETPRGATRYVITYAASARSVSDFAFVFLPGIFTRPTRHPRLAPRTVEVDPVETRTPPQSSQSTCS